MEEHGEILVYRPSSQDIEDEKFDLDFSFYIASNEELDKIIAAAKNVSEIEDAVGEEITDFSTQVEEKKEENFSFTYSDNEYLYIAKGYGIQETGGYSVSVDDCYLTKTNIVVKTRLHGPAVGEDVAKTPSYPNIVLKMELCDREVIFE